MILYYYSHVLLWLYTTIFPSKRKLVYFPTNGDYTLRDAIIALSFLKLLVSSIFLLYSIFIRASSNFLVYLGKEQFVRLQKLEDVSRAVLTRPQNYFGVKPRNISMANFSRGQVSTLNPKF